MRYLILAAFCLSFASAVAGTISSGGVVPDTANGVDKVNGRIRVKAGDGIAFDSAGNVTTVPSPLVQGGMFFVESGQLTATVPLTSPISAAYSVVPVLVSPVTPITVGVTRTESFDVILEWNGSGATGYWIAVKY